MSHAVHVQESRTYPVAVEETFDRLLVLPLPELFRHRYGAIPRITGVDQLGAGAWGTVGQTRTIRLADGGTMRETLTAVDRPSTFGYDMAGFTGALSALVVSARGRWSVEPAGTGSRVTWAWDLVPKGPAGRIAMPVFTRFWRGYARAALAELETLLLR